MTTASLHRLYLHELRHLMHRRVSSILLIMIALLLGFSLFDFLMMAERFALFFPLRLLAALAGVLMLLTNHLDRRGRFAQRIGLFSYLCVSAVILVIIQRLEPASASQHVGLIVAMSTYIILAPLTAVQTLLWGLPLALAYYLIVFVFSNLSDFQPLESINNLFFMLSFIFIATVQSWAENKARSHEFQLRRSEKLAARDLKSHVRQLEAEAQRREQEQRMAEQRYRAFYDSIADAVVLVDFDGRILQANGAWFKEFAGPADLFPAYFEAQERQRLQDELLSPIEHGQSITGWQICLHSAEGRPLDVEINGVLLMQEGKKIGLQLVIRDIGTRKALEQQLHESLDKLRKMEDMTILALAKISEYRDASPGQHLERIREYSLVLATSLAGIPQYRETVTPHYIRMLAQGALLHDIGKVAVSDEILARKTALNAEEEQQFQQHTVLGADFIGGMETEVTADNFLSLARNIARSHHEHWDGSGYPDGLRGEAIPLEARIVSLAHAYEDLTVTDSAEDRLDHAQAVRRLLDDAGERFDPLLLDALAARQQTFAEIAASLAEPDGQAEKNTEES